MSKKITVFGSFIVDLMARTPHLPVPGETVKGSMFKMSPGGKGFNQGVAAYKAGGEVTMITKLGKDTFGQVAVEAMQSLSMDTSYLLYTTEAETGTALIMVDEVTSQNEIVVVPGAGNTITEAEVDSFEAVLAESRYLLTQLETNSTSIERAILLAAKHGVKIILNPAPVQEISEEMLSKVYLITPNEVEAEILTGIKIEDEACAQKAAKWFKDRGVKNVIITLGGRGVFISSEDKEGIIPAYRVAAVDTTGAGDAFNGGLVTALAEGQDLWEASRFANALAALSVQKIGAMPSMPTRVEIEAFIRENN